MMPTTPCAFLDCQKPALPGLTKCASHKNKIKCSVEGCMNQVYARYLCVRHGGKKQCQTPGCEDFARGGAYCVTHGGVVVKRYCTEPGCNRQAHARYKCVRHGGGRTCKHTGCDLHARSSGYCHRHTQHKAPVRIKDEPVHDAVLQLDSVFVELFDVALLDASQEWCSSQTDSLDHSILSLLCESLAAMHNSQPKDNVSPRRKGISDFNMELTCLFIDCTKPVVPGTEKCAAHKNKIKCSVDGCPNQVYARYLCVRHGGKKQCKLSGCRAFARGGPYCVQHGGVATKRFCTEKGCHRQAHARHKCVRHGGGRLCKLMRCERQARITGFCDVHSNPALMELELPDIVLDLTDSVDEYSLLLCASVNPMPFSASAPTYLESVFQVVHASLLKTMFGLFLRPLKLLTTASSRGNNVVSICIMLCTFTECNKPAMVGSNKCVTHKNKLKCSRNGCNNQVYARYLCVRHGGKRQCEQSGCRASTTAAVLPSVYAASQAVTAKLTPGISVFDMAGAASADMEGAPCTLVLGGIVVVMLRRATNSRASNDTASVDLPFLKLLESVLKDDNVWSPESPMDSIDRAILNLLCEAPPSAWRTRTNLSALKQVVKTKCTPDTFAYAMEARNNVKPPTATSASALNQTVPVKPTHATDACVTGAAAGASLAVAMCMLGPAAIATTIITTTVVIVNQWRSKAAVKFPPSIGPTKGALDTIDKSILDVLSDIFVMSADDPWLSASEFGIIDREAVGAHSSTHLAMGCTFLGCTKPELPDVGKCASHKNKIKCMVAGCLNQVYARYLCVRHGGKKPCEHTGCDAFASRGPYCVLHGGSIVKRFCIEPGCERQAHARFRCVRHGGGRYCTADGCNLHARSSGLCHRHLPRSAAPRTGLRCRTPPLRTEKIEDDGPLPLHAAPRWTTALDVLDYSILNMLCDSLQTPKALSCLELDLGERHC
ncbi:hypothetical protein ACHHYP_17284 [Achlya hypogyna]|uniref:WRKY transcription factor 19 n=1 Tax=Achlya hypogyna TaxID=1202772 RepID=A0A1V9Y4S3_ACHHY|nr:hypothetical protein ACHHYP_17284 [Achlya hypogyna]